jgi:hypothetical protein
MKHNWLSDARLISDEVMSYLREIAVCAVKENPKWIHIPFPPPPK